ncbi:MAG: hypothetical protein ACRD1Y_11020 [Terriglobales bacterium]
MPDSGEEIVLLLAAHAGEPVDYVAIVTLLNTVAGGHYEERHTEAEIRAALLHLLLNGRILAVPADDAQPVDTEAASTGRISCTFQLAGAAKP